jgi:hypothetical protein
MVHANMDFLTIYEVIITMSMDFIRSKSVIRRVDDQVDWGKDRDIIFSIRRGILVIVGVHVCG